jgi:drug/metabolite transporter (DMT)-like permease
MKEADDSRYKSHRNLVDDDVDKINNNSASTTQSELSVSSGTEFTACQQFLAVAAYIIADTLLRFLYQAVVNGMEKENLQIEEYDKPMLLSWLCYCCFALISGAVVIPYLCMVRRMSPWEYLQTEWCGSMGFSRALTWCSGAIFLLYGQNYLYVAGLRYIRVAISTAVGQAEAPFTVGLSVLVLGHVFGNYEKCGVVLCFTGIALIAFPPLFRIDSGYEDGEEEYQEDVGLEIVGIVFTTIGALFFSVYQIFWQAFDAGRFPVQGPGSPSAAVIDIFATIMVLGSLNILFGWIFVLGAHVVGIEPFEMPPSSMRGALTVTSFLSAFVDGSNGVACVVASPIIVAMCYPLTIPLAVILEWIWSGISLQTWGMLGWIGTMLVVSGVFFLEKDDQEELGCESCEFIDDIDVNSPLTCQRARKDYQLMESGT